MNYIKLYADFLKKFLKPKRKMKVVFDCSNGTTGLVIKKLRNLEIKKLRAILINDKIDGNFPAHGPNPMNEGAMDDLITVVKKEKADLGIIFDGDGDRVFFIDNKGRLILADIVIALVSRNYRGPVVMDVRVGYLGRELAAADKKRVINSRVGHYFMKKVMAKYKISFGGELSGHYYFYFTPRLHSGQVGYYADSGIFTAIQFINAASKLDTDLATWIDTLPRYYRSGEVNFEVKDKEAAMKKIENVHKARAKRISHLDGVKMEFGDFWFNVRSSNTEDLLRLNLEAKKKSVFDREFAEIKKMME